MFNKEKSKKSTFDGSTEGLKSENSNAPYSYLPSTRENNNFGTSLADENFEDNRERNKK